MEPSATAHRLQRIAFVTPEVLLRLIFLNLQNFLNGHGRQSGFRGRQNPSAISKTAT